MAQMDELAGSASTMLKANLEAGIENISYFQEIEFFQYVRVVLPADGFVFWVRRASLSKSALINIMSLNNVPPNQVQRVASYAPSFVVKGSLHVATNLEQEETETFAVSRVILTTQEEVKNLQSIDPLVMYIAAPTNNDVRYSFSSHDNFYRAAQTWHYGGSAIYSDIASQLIENPSTFSTNNLIVSNSLPIWLSMNSYVQKPWDIIGKPAFPLYPSFTVPQNLTPPFASVHVEPQQTRSLSSTSTLTDTGSSYQLCSDLVKITMYGANNDAAQDFLDFVCQFTLDNPCLLGLMNNPVIRDEKRGQVELNALSQKKTVEIQIDYYQSRVRNVSRQLIELVQETFLIAAEAA